MNNKRQFKPQKH